MDRIEGFQESKSQWEFLMDLREDESAEDRG